MRWRLKNVIFILLLIVLVAIFIFLIVMLVKLDIKRYDEACSNPPSEVWIEEDLEMVFLTTQVNVLEIENQSDGVLIVKVRIYDEGAYRTYRCLYEVKRYELAYYTWELVRYV